MKVAATWSYATTEPAAAGASGTVTGTKVVTVEASEAVPARSGITAWRLHTVIPGVEDQVTWQAETSTSIIRYRDEVHASGSTDTASLQSTTTYAPSKFRIDTSAARMVTGAKYTESFTETVTDAAGTTSSSKPYGWKVVNTAEPIAVPAGAFTAVHIQKSNGNSSAVDKDYWFVRGVGKVKETSAAGRTEVLTSYNIP